MGETVIAALFIFFTVLAALNPLVVDAYSSISINISVEAIAITGMILMYTILVQNKSDTDRQKEHNDIIKRLGEIEKELSISQENPDLNNNTQNENAISEGTLPLFIVFVMAIVFVFVAIHLLIPNFTLGNLKFDIYQIFQLILLAITAIATSFYAYLTWKSVQPLISIMLEPDQNDNLSMNLTIENVGFGVAYDVKIKVMMYSKEEEEEQEMRDRIKSSEKMNTIRVSIQIQKNNASLK